MNTPAHNRPVRLGMAGGGQGAFIGAVHRMAARLDGHYELVAGALSSDPDRAIASAQELGLDPDRSYESYEAMLAAEAGRDDGIEAVAVVTPNHMHYPIARAFLEGGFHVICDKPLTATLDEARELRRIADESGRILAVTYNYSGYPMVRQAREMVRRGDLGKIRVVQAEYAQEWLSENIEDDGQKQAVWRTDPSQAGAGGCVGDIGTHAFHLAGFISGLQPEALCADLSTFVENRRLDDNAQILLRYAGGARGMIWASQVAPGNENNLGIRIYGSRGGLEWHQENPNELLYSPLGEPTRRITRGGHGAQDAAARITRIPAGHPEGYLEGFATIYSEIAKAILASRENRSVDADVLFPDARDGERGVVFVDAVVRSSTAGAQWVKLGSKN